MSESVVHVVGGSLTLHCPACGCAHVVSVSGDKPHWFWDGDEARPTISPSILVTGAQWPEDDPFHKENHDVEAGGETRCHSFVTEGEWRYLDDSTHTYAGDFLPCVPWQTEETDE